MQESRFLQEQRLDLRLHLEREGGFMNELALVVAYVRPVRRAAVALMAQTAQTNTPGDGPVLVLPVASAVRVSDLSSWVSPLHTERTEP